MRLKILWIGLVLIMGLPALSHGVPVRGLYEALVPLNDDTEQQRSIAQQAAMAQVLVKLTGIQEIALHGQYQGLLQQASNYVQQYQIRQAADDMTNLMGTRENTMPLTLSVRFDATAMQALVRRQGLPIWSEDRPSTLVLLAVEKGMQPVLLGLEEELELKEIVSDVASKRAIPVIWPLMDIDDRRNINLSEVWGGFLDRLSLVRERYDANNLLVGRAIRSQGTWRIRWTLVFASGVIEDWIGSAKILGDALKEGVHHLADTLARNYAVGPADSNEGQILVAVRQVRTLADYVKVSQYLEKLSPIRTLDVVSVHDGEVVFRLNILGDLSVLRRAIGMESLLAPYATYRDDSLMMVESGADIESMLHYRLVP